MAILATVIEMADGLLLLSKMTLTTVQVQYRSGGGKKYLQMHAGMGIVSGGVEMDREHHWHDACADAHASDRRRDKFG